MVDSLKKHKKSSNQWFYFPLYQTVINVEQTAFKKSFFRPNIIFYYLLLDMAEKNRPKYAFRVFFKITFDSIKDN